MSKSESAVLSKGACSSLVSFALLLFTGDITLSDFADDAVDTALSCILWLSGATFIILVSATGGVFRFRFFRLRFVPVLIAGALFLLNKHYGLPKS